MLADDETFAQSPELVGQPGEGVLRQALEILERRGGAGGPMDGG